MKVKVNGYEVEGSVAEVAQLLNLSESHPKKHLSNIAKKAVATRKKNANEGWKPFNELRQQLQEESKKTAVNANQRFKRGQVTNIKRALKNFQALPEAEMADAILAQCKKYGRTAASILAAYYG